MKKKKKEVSELLLKRLAIIILLVIVISLSLICAGIIKLNHINHDSIKKFNANRNRFDDIEVVDNSVEIDTSKLSNVLDVFIDESSTRLYDTCVDNCNIRINEGGIYYYYLIEKNIKDKYELTIVKDNKSIIYKKNIGENLINLQILYYMGYLTLYNTYADEFFTYDYSIVVDSNNNYDEYTSLNSNEMEFSGKGIIYYYDLCEKDKSYKIKAIRKPFNETTYILTKNEEKFPWC